MLIIYILILYLAAGLLFSLPFLTRWIHLLDEATHDTSVTFKLTILPGCIVFWPVLLKKLLQTKSGNRG